MVTDILNREIHIGDTVLRARTRKVEEFFGVFIKLSPL